MPATEVYLLAYFGYLYFEVRVGTSSVRQYVSAVTRFHETKVLRDYTHTPLLTAMVRLTSLILTGTGPFLWNPPSLLPWSPLVFFCIACKPRPLSLWRTVFLWHFQSCSISVSFPSPMFLRGTSRYHHSSWWLPLRTEKTSPRNALFD